MAAKTAKKQIKSSFKKPLPAGKKKPAAQGQSIQKKAVVAAKKIIAKKIAQKKVVVKKSLSKTTVKKPISKPIAKKPILKKITTQTKKAAAPKSVSQKTPLKKCAPKTQIIKKIAVKTINTKSAPSKKTKQTNAPIKKSVKKIQTAPIKQAPKNFNKAKGKPAAKTTDVPLKKIVKKDDNKSITKSSAAAKKAVSTKKTSAKTETKSAEKVKSASTAKSVASQKIDSPAPKNPKATKSIVEEIFKDIIEETKAAKMQEKTKKGDSSKKILPNFNMDAPRTSKKRSGKHVRPSESIAFTLEDLDSYLERRENGTPISISKEIAISKQKHTAPVVPVKPVVVVAQKPASNKPLAPASIFDILGFNPVEAPSREKLDEKDVPKKWKKYYDLLIDLRKHHSAGVETRSEEVMKRSAKEDSGDLSSYGQHLADAGSESFERDMTYNILSAEKETLAEIDEAIKRIKNGTYGICEVTGQQIPDQRLSAIPFTRFTKEGQERKEIEQKRIKASQRNVFDIPSTAAGGDDDSNAQ